MKSFTTVSLVLLQAAAVYSLPAELERRQGALGGLMALALGKPMEPVSREKLEPQMDSTATRERLIFGPYRMLSSKAPSHPSKGLSGGIKLDPNSDTQSAMLAGICTECMILTANMETSDKTGKKVGITEGIYTHHFITMDMGRNQVPNPVKSPCAPKPGSLGMGGMMGNSDAHSHGRRQLPNFMFGAGVSVFVGKGNEDWPLHFCIDE